MSESAREPELEDRLFLIDASRSMGWKLKGEKQNKLGMVTEGLFAFCSKLWPLSYYDKPTRIGITAFRLLGVPGETKFEVIIPLYPSPVSLELYRLQKIDAKGGCFVSDGLKYASIVLRESERTHRRLDLISDGDNQGPDPIPYARIFKDLGVFVNMIEVAENPTTRMQDIALHSGGKYWLVHNAYDLALALT